MKTVNIVYNLITYKILRIEIDGHSKLARGERAKSISPAYYKILGTRAEIAKALGLQQ